MDSYNLFGDDGSGMLEGLTDLGGTDGFTNSSTAAVSADNKESDSGYRQSYGQGGVTQESSIQKLASFSSTGGGGIPAGGQAAPPGAPPPEYHDYGSYPPRPRLPQPPHAPLHPSHHAHPTHTYAGYHPGPDPMYGIPEHPGIGDIGVWSNSPGPNRYSSIAPTYRHTYEHQQKMHQYPPQQGPSIGGIQSQNGSYLPRQPHFPQPPSQPVYAQQQGYPSYTQMHPPASSRINQHPSYHQQMDINAHQYGLQHGQQTHASIPQHQGHQNLGSHGGGLGAHPGLHLHHAAGAMHHVARQPPQPPGPQHPPHPPHAAHPPHAQHPPASAAPAHPSQLPYASPHHAVPMNYQPHQIQHPLDINVPTQYNTNKPAVLETGSPQYRPPFHQISPQVSPRAQMSPRQQAPPQSSPRPVISPVKGTSASPHSSRNQVTAQSPASSVSTSNPNSFGPQNTLQALEQMVLPSGSEYPYQRNPTSPAVLSSIPGHLTPTQWSQNKIVTHNIIQMDTNDQTAKSTDPLATSVQSESANSALKNIDMISDKEKEKCPGVDEDVSTKILSDEPTKEVVSKSKLNEPTNLGEYADGNDKEISDESVTKQSEHNVGSEIDTNEKSNDPRIKEQQYSSVTNIDRQNDQVMVHSLIPKTSSTSSTIGNPSSQLLSATQSHPTTTTELTENKQTNSTNINRPQHYLGNNSSQHPGPNTLSQHTGGLPPNLQTSLPASGNQTISTYHNTHSGSPIPNQAQVSMHPPVQSNMAIINTTLQSGSHSNMPGNMSLHSNPSSANSMTNITTLQNNIPTSITNVQGALPNLQPNIPQGMTGVQVGVPMGVQNIQTNVQNIPTNVQNNSQNILPSISHNLNSGVMIMGPNHIPPSVQGMYSMLHHQERSSIQQQIQEIYCLPPSSENQEKVRCLQERLSVLQLHETNDKCTGGPNCVLLNSNYGSKMVESPQVTSTTGRGRGKGPAKPRKPRAKKDKTVTSLVNSLDQLPVSEDCVTAGTGLHSNSEMDVELNEDISNLDGSILSLDDSNVEKNKKQRAPRKERKPRTPKEPKTPKVVKDKLEKPIKERKKREPKDPNAPKRRRNVKKEGIEIQADTTTTSYEASEKKIEMQSGDADNVNKGHSSLEQSLESNVTDFDDIPVSKIAIKDLLEEAEAKRELAEIDDDTDSLNQSIRKRSRKRSAVASGSSTKKNIGKRLLLGKRKKRSGLIPDSDGEPDDMMTTPPPSPPLEGDDSLKRRSARHTQRKKYTDDVMLRLSDDEYSALSTPKRERECKPEELQMDVKDTSKLDGIPKPNYIYVNTTEEDSMIVQYVLASRMGKREMKVDLPDKLDSTAADIDDKGSTTDNMDDKESTTDNVDNKDLDGDDKELLVTKSISEATETISETEPKEEQEQKVDLELIPDETMVPGTEPEKPTQKELDTNESKPVLVDVEEYYVKYRNFSYLHCEWKTEDELYKGDKRIFSKIKRFKLKQAQLNIFEMLDEEPFNPDYIEVERILDESENVDPGNESVVKHYLVKWKSLQYEDCTWELQENVDEDKISQYKVFSEIPPKEKWKYKKRPSPDLWVQLKESPLYKGGNTLRPYQLEGLNWLTFSWHNNRNCILADEMGLGKTIQSLTFVNAVWEYGIRGPFLIIAPLSTIPNWQREFEGWTDMNVIVYHGSQQSKSMIQEYEFYYKNEKGEPIKDITKFNVLITTFEIIVTDFQELKSFNWRACVIDEAHRLKNRNCKLLEGLRQLHLEHRVLLSGTPLQNNVNELFSLLNFLEPSQFSSNEAFLNEFGQLKTESEVLKLQALLKPMMLRRLKEDVEKTLAPKEETIIEVELTNIQKKYYRAILERNFSFLQKGTGSAANIPNLMNTMMELRKVCIHPYLLNGAEDQIQYDYKQANGEDKEAYYKALIQSSGKMVLMDKLLPKLKSGGHRVLIFSQMVRCLDILEDYLMFRKYPFERIDGRIRGNLRQEAIDRFSKPDSDRFVFLLCTKAGGLGINLTAADTVIIYDSDWNPQNDLQAQARCHRIGQQKMVKIYRLICRNSYEREMFDKASLKLGLDKAILQSMNTTQGKETGLRQLSKKEIEDLLKKGAYGAVMDEDNAGDKFCEEDIEMILARRTQVIQMESEKGSTFSKASFASTDQRSDIDIRDPDFWNKWAKKAEIDTTEKKEEEDLIVTEPRKRTIIKRYGHDDGPMEMSDMDATPDTDEDEDGISLRSKKKKDKLGRKGKKYASDDYIPRHEGVPVDEEVVYGSWTRSECFKIERGLLTFGWGRWDEIVDKNQFRKGWTLPVIEDCARIIVLYCLRHYKGDEKIRNFIWDLIEPCENGEVTIARNHSGLHNPVPRGRNAKKKNRPKDVPKLSDVQKWEDSSHWSFTEKYDCETYLENSYKKHLFRHANKVLLRVRMMYYIKHEIIGDYAIQIESAAHASTLGMRVPRGVDSAPPRLWWDSECDVSLLVGTYVHGYENYLDMRSDPQLCFVDKLGPPDDAECTDIKSEERKVRGAAAGDEDCTDEVSSGAGAASPAAPGSPGEPRHQWPSMQDLNTRLRRLITAYQRNYKREELKLQQKAKMDRRERLDQMNRDESSQWRWTRADEEAFRRTVASYGVEFDPTTKSLRWGRFRALARLESKSDDALTDYLKAFMAMCKRQCGLSVGEAELPTRSDLKAEPIGEERAIATLERIDLLRVLREEVAPHPLLEARLAGCARGAGAPPWWAPAAHDRLLVLQVAKHGLGDTYHKIFCDPKLPFAECATKWYAANRTSKKTESHKESSDEEEDAKDATEDPTFEPKMSLRRSKRNSNNCDRENSEDTDALSELETLAKMGRNEESPPQNYWFSERALETRLHHIAHAVQNCEWPADAPAERPEPERKQPPKRHIAIDVETERAKLHALLSSPRAAHSPGGPGRRTPGAPPPAHQRPARADTPRAPADAAPLDLSEPARPPPAADHAPPRRLDDTLSRLMKRKNVPAPEPIVGKEKKRKKLDEIVLGLSAAKSTQNPLTSPLIQESSRGKSSPILPNVSVTPVAAPPSTSPAHATQKPFSVTVTNVPSAHSVPKELSSFLQQSLEQTGKSHKTNSTPIKSFSHEAKVNKWLAEQANVDNRRRAATPRLAPDEHVPVVHRVTGKRIAGNKAPQLKHLAQWIAENPMYDIDTKWTEGIKEHVKLPQDVRSQRHSPMQASNVPGERKKGRPPSLDTSSANMMSSNPHLNQNIAGLNPALLASLSAFDPKTLASTLSNLTGFDPKLLNTFDPKLLSSLSSFDPKNNPLLNSFSSMPNLLGGNLFANLAGLGLPGLSSLDMSGLGASGSSIETKNKSRKQEGATSSNKSSSSQFPFVFPNPNMLYPQLGLSGLNPFGMHGGISSAYDALGLLSSSLATTSGTSTIHSSSHNSSRSNVKTSTTPKSSTVVTSSAQSRQQKQPSSQTPQIYLPPDTYLLESLSKQSMAYENLLKAEKQKRDLDNHEATDLSKVDKKKSHYDALRSIPPEFAAVQEKLLKGDKKDIDISKMLLEQMASGALSASLVSAVEGKKSKDHDSKEIYDRLSKHSSEYLNRAAEETVIDKRSHEDLNEPENLSVIQHDLSKSKESAPECNIRSDNKLNTHTNTGEMDLEDLIAPSTVIRSGVKPSELENKLIITEPEERIPSESINEVDNNAEDVHKNQDLPDENPSDETLNDPNKKGIKKKIKALDEGSGQRRELRSNASRQSTDTPPQTSST